MAEDAPAKKADARIDHICCRAGVLLGVSEAVANNIKEEEKNTKNMNFFFENEDDKVRWHDQCSQAWRSCGCWQHIWCHSF